MIVNYFENLGEKKKIVIAYCLFILLFILVAVIAVNFQSPKKSVDSYKISATPVNDSGLTDRVRIKHSSNKSDFEQSDDSNYAMKSKTKYFKSYFAAETNGESLVKTKMAIYSLDWQLLDTNKSKAKFEDRKVVYPEVFEGVDLQYIYSEKKLSEQFILNKPSKNVFSFRMDANDMTYEKKSNGEIVFKSKITGNEVWKIPAPFMVDAKGQVSKEVAFNIREKDGQLYGDLVANKDWLNSKDRQFPVVVDPEIYTDYFISPMVIDTYVQFDDESGVDSNHVNEDELIAEDSYIEIGSWHFNSWATILVKINGLESIPSYAKIYSANLSFYGEASNTDNQETTNIYIGKINDPWNPEEVLYENAPSSEEYYSYRVNVGDNKRFNFDILRLFKSWRQGNNYGLDISTNGYFKVKSSQYSELNKKPYLEVVWMDPHPNTPQITSVTMNQLTGKLLLIGSGESGTKVNVGGLGTAYVNNGMWLLDNVSVDEGKEYNLLSYATINIDGETYYSGYSNPYYMLRYQARTIKLGNIANYYYDDSSASRIISKNSWIISDPFFSFKHLLIYCPDYTGIYDPYGPPKPKQSSAFGHNKYNMVFKGDPVNSATGNFSLQETDLLIPGIGSALEFTRTYNGLDSYKGPLGNKWNFTYNTRLEVNSDSSITIINSDGRWDTYTYQGNGQYLTPPNVTSTLTANGDNTFTLKTKEKNSYVYDISGNLNYIIDKNGNKTRLEYGNYGLLSRVVDPSNRALTFEWVNIWQNSDDRNIGGTHGR